MTSRWLHPSRLLFLATLSVLNFSCGLDEDLGADISIGVSPSNPFIVDGNGVSCVDAAEAKNTDDPPNTSIAPLRVLFTQFRLQWRSPDVLKIVALKVTVTGAGIPTESPIEYLLDETELEYLLGLEGLTIPAGNADRVLDIFSDSTQNKAVNSKYAPCGLMLGGLDIDPDQGRFTATIQLELVGYAVASDQTQRPIRQTARAQARFL